MASGRCTSTSLSPTTRLLVDTAMSVLNSKANRADGSGRGKLVVRVAAVGGSCDGCQLYFVGSVWGGAKRGRMLNHRFHVRINGVVCRTAIERRGSSGQLIGRKDPPSPGLSASVVPASGQSWRSHIVGPFLRVTVEHQGGLAGAAACGLHPKVGFLGEVAVRRGEEVDEKPLLIRGLDPAVMQRYLVQSIELRVDLRPGRGEGSVPLVDYQENLQRHRCR